MSIGFTAEDYANGSGVAIAAAVCVVLVEVSIESIAMDLTVSVA